ncbi:HNH endonuclease [Lysobacter fragariae]
MRFWLGVTDNQWFNFVSSHQCPEVNFWQPSARAPFVDLPEGTPFLFKLKRPNHHIAGGGHFVRHTRLPLSTAWDVFGQQNGADSLQEFIRLISGNRADPATLEAEIGCTVVTDVFYLPQPRWVSAEGRFEKNIVVGRTADTLARAEDLALWNELQFARSSSAVLEQVPEQARYGREFIAKSRLGQGSFRTLVIDAYGRRCAITGENTLPVLEAAHIQPYAESGPHQVSNGLLLRSDFHKLFDAGLVTVEPDYRVRVSGKIRDRYFNGKAYYRLDGQQLASLPENAGDQPDPGFLGWHNNHRFVA